ncbi:MAG: hypothetical protein IPJ27_15815 [Candidatus Accumulibacter sp.]|uniref:Uncharacterized protein n=1 Tax=Candidatus Accumulibacter proximus TaxID=2954385 RepID=A0A935Q1M4_9PROT|nr:hypothetical protein [Candidatus Accumulibacter proximus]
MIKTLLAALIVTTTLIGGTATAQTGSGTLGKIKSAKVINVAYSPDSLPFSFVGAKRSRPGIRSICANASLRRLRVRLATQT